MDPFVPIHVATSWMFGTVAETSTNRTAAPLVFMRDTTTSKVLPRDSFSTWIYHIWVNGREGSKWTEPRQREITWSGIKSDRDRACLTVETWLIKYRYNIPCPSEAVPLLCLECYWVQPLCARKINLTVVILKDCLWALAPDDIEYKRTLY